MRKSKILILLKIFFPQENFYFVTSRCTIEWTKFRLTNLFLFVHNELFFFQFYISNYTTQPNFV